MKVKAGIVVDLGNSETRVIVLSNGKEQSFELSNRFASLPMGYNIPKEYAQVGKSNVLKVNEQYYCNGALADREFVDRLLRPTAVVRKTDQLVTELTMHLIFAKVVMMLAEARGMAVSEIQAAFDVSILLPPLEQEVKESELEEKIKAIKTVSVLLPFEFESAITVETVKVIPEGFAAYFGVCYEVVNGDVVEVESNKKYSKGYVLIVDIGAGTTDILVIQDNALLSNSRNTFAIGGNTVESNVKLEIKKRFGFAPKVLSEIVKTCNLEDGDTIVDVRDIVKAAKEKYANTLLAEIRDYFDGMSISLREVKGLLVCGGGALPSIVDGEERCAAMSKILIEYLKEIASNITELDTQGKNPRLLNIEGLKYIHKVLH